MFNVKWSRSAKSQLANVWMSADSSLREKITKYTSQLVRHLRANADRIGESRSGAHRWFPGD